MLSYITNTKFASFDELYVKIYLVFFHRRAKREAAQSAHAHKAEADEMDDIEDENNVKIWTFLLNGEPTSVVLRKFQVNLE